MTVAVRPRSDPDVRFARALRAVKNGGKQPKDPRRDDQPGQEGKRRADPYILRGVDIGENHPKSAERGEKGAENGRAERRNPRHAGMLIARLRMAAGADIRVGISAAQRVAEEQADDGEQKTDQKTDQINILFHKRVQGLPEPAPVVTYKVMGAFVTGGVNLRGFDGEEKIKKAGLLARHVFAVFLRNLTVSGPEGPFETN